MGFAADGIRYVWPKVVVLTAFRPLHAGILPALVPAIQGLGKIDAELDAEDSAYSRRKTAAAKSNAKLARFTMLESDVLTIAGNAAIGSPGSLHQH